ncbi:MAG: response regulator [Nitrospirota bacterium]
MDSRKKILVVDDDERLLLTTKDILENEGYEVHTHDQALGTTGILMTLQPDLVLLDMNMPALSGESLARILLLKVSTRGIPIVFYSSNDEDSIREAVTKQGVTGYICKGDLQGLRKKVAMYVGQE